MPTTQFMIRTARPIRAMPMVGRVCIRPTMKAFQQDAGGEDAVEFARTRLGFLADPVQEELLRSRGRRVLLNCSRQWGKSTITAVRALWHAVSRRAGEHDADRRLRVRGRAANW